MQVNAVNFVKSLPSEALEELHAAVAEERRYRATAEVLPYEASLLEAGQRINACRAFKDRVCCSLPEAIAACRKYCQQHSIYFP